MADCLTSGFPNVFLGIELRTGWWKEKQLQARLVSQKGGNGLTFVPGCPVKEQQNGLNGKNGQQMIEEVNESVAIEGWQGQGYFLAGRQGKCPEKMEAIALWANLYGRSLADWKPDAGKGGLKLQTHLVEHDQHAVRMVLDKIGHFFSVSPSHSAITASLGRERYIPSARW